MKTLDSDQAMSVLRGGGYVEFSKAIYEVFIKSLAPELRTVISTKRTLTGDIQVRMACA
jgi:hypothetical protein